MTRKKPARRKPARPIVIQTSDELVASLHEIMPIGEGKEPELIHAWLWPTREFRRIDVFYPNGWVLRVNCNRHGDISSTRASYRIVRKIFGKRGTAINDEAVGL